MAKKMGLGKGLGALIPDSVEQELLIQRGEKVQRIAIDDIVPYADQPRTTFDEAALNTLATSIKNHGIIQPLVLKPAKKGYEIIAGERRWRAAKLAGLKTVPSLIRTPKQLEQLELALVENIHRVDLSPLEQAVSIVRLHDQFSLEYSAIAKRLGKSTSAVSNLVRLLQLPDYAKEALIAGKLSEGHARQVLALKDLPEQQKELVRLIVAHGWNVREAERYVVSVKAGHNEPKEAKARVSTETPETKRLSKRYGTTVAIRRTAKGGRVEIAFSGDDELARIISELSK